jgi:DNA-binding NtrC family response regulator
MSTPLRVLVVDDDRVSRNSTSLQLKGNGDDAMPVESPFLALKLLEQEVWDVVVTDLRMPGMSGIELLQKIHALGSDVDVIVMTAFATVETAVEAMQMGAVDYLVKPFQFAELSMRLDKIRELRSARTELKTLHAIVDNVSGANGLLGSSQEMASVHERILIFAEHDAPVLVTGETGTGKELVARALHADSGRADHPFVPLACGAIPPELAESELFGHEKGAYTGAHGRTQGIFERADKGTVLLDDVDDLPLNMQVKLLRVLQEGTLMRVGGSKETHVDVRIIATSKVDLASRVEAGGFRDDLFYRLRGLEIFLPPLRERGDDVLILAQHFLQLVAGREGRPPAQFTAAAADLMRNYPWPGNVRELRRSVESAFILSRGGDIEPVHFPLSMPRQRNAAAKSGDLFSLSLSGCSTVDMAKLTREFEEALLLWALSCADGQQAKAAELLGLPRTTFQSKLGSVAKPQEVRGSESGTDIGS